MTQLDYCDMDDAGTHLVVGTGALPKTRGTDVLGHPDVVRVEL